MPLGAERGMLLLSRPSHGCHVSLTAWDPRRFLSLPGSVLSGCSSSDGLKVVGTLDG